MGRLSKVVITVVLKAHWRRSCRHFFQQSFGSSRLQLTAGDVVAKYHAILILVKRVSWLDLGAAGCGFLLELAEKTERGIWATTPWNNH